MTVYFQSTGVEELIDEVESVLIDNINESLADVYLRKQQADIDRAIRRNTEYLPLEYDPIPEDHFHTGNFPSLALDEVPQEAYPYIVITVEDFTADAESAIDDHRNVYRDALVIHSLAQASIDEGSEIVFRRALRMGEAAFITVMNDESLSRRLHNLSNPVRGQHSIPWTANYQGLTNSKWWFQAVGISLAIKSYTSFYQ